MKMYEGVMVQLPVFLASARDEFKMVSLVLQLPFPHRKIPLNPLDGRLTVLEICGRSAENKNLYLFCESKNQASPQHISYID
jgi:hypothetical protein